MIFKTLEYIRVNLNDFMVSAPMPINPGNDRNTVVLENVAKMEDPNFDGANKVILSLVNVEEESALKNRRAYEIVNNEVEYKRPPVVLNLYVLFSANLNKYEDSLMALSKLMSFFQAKNYFSYAEDPPAEDGASIDFTPEEQDAFRVTLDLYTLTFEQLNHLWGSLGGKQIPAAMYKLRVVPVERTQILDEGRIIERIKREGTVD